MILIISLTETHPSLHYYEFVRPVERYVKEAGVPYKSIHYSEDMKTCGEVATRIILCGTALGDNRVLDDLDVFEWLKHADCWILGICVGADLLAKLYGGAVRPCVEIGATKIEVDTKACTRAFGSENVPFYALDKKEVYELHALAPVIPDGFIELARSRKCVQIFRKNDREVYGMLFHPEVRHGEIIKWFCNRS